MKDKVIGPGNPKRVSKSPCECRIRNGLRMPKERKWAKDAQRGKRWDKGARKQCNGPRKPKVA